MKEEIGKLEQMVRENARKQLNNQIRQACQAFSRTVIDACGTSNITVCHVRKDPLGVFEPVTLGHFEAELANGMLLQAENAVGDRAVWAHLLSVQEAEETIRVDAQRYKTVSDMADGYRGEIRNLIAVIRNIRNVSRNDQVVELITPILAEYESID
jgi:hypothetical protein